MVVLFLIFWGTSILFSTVAAPIYIPINSAQGLPFLHTLTNCFVFFFLIFIYLFIYFWLCWVFVSVWGLSLVVASGGHSSSRCAGLSLSWPLLFRSTSSRHAGSVVVAHGLSCSAACGIFPDQGSNPCPLHWQADSQPLCHQGRPVIFWWWLFWQVWGDISFYSGFAFLWWLVTSSIFSFTRWPSVCLLWKNVCSDPLPISKILFFFFFAVELYEFFVWVCSIFTPAFNLSHEHEEEGLYKRFCRCVQIPPYPGQLEVP